ncbi:MAG: DNA gyrase C-terminal beta-propeller domain-containing protein, partial [Lachnospiraceae bacterium]
QIILISSLKSLLGHRLIFASSDGMIKTVDGCEFDVAKRTTAATKLNQGAKLQLVQILTENMEETMVMQTEKNMFLRFAVSDVPKKKKGAVGVRGMKIDSKDSLLNSYLLGEEELTIEVKEKEIALSRLRVSNRDGKGVKK